MTIQSHITTLFFLVVIGFAFTQKHRTEPKCPKGDPAAQMLALVPYNEAVDLYVEGELQQAKRKLKKSVNTSFALVEAHLFLADILYEEGVRDSALYFYKSGLDFVIEQEPHYYFRLFELGMEFEQYDLVKQYLKYFKKVHKVKEHGELYEAGYPFTVEDYNYYADQIAFVYNYKSWQSPWQYEKTETISHQVYSENAMVLNDRLMLHKYKSNGCTKWKKAAKLPSAVHSFQYLQEEQLVLMTIQEDSTLHLYAGKLRGKKVIEQIKLGPEINSTEWTADPFYDVQNQLLYFSRKTSEGDWDLFVAKWNSQTNEVSTVAALDRVNTSKDERSPYLKENTFYFCSNGYEGFGGMDVYFTPDFESINGLIFPMNHYNMKSGVNSGADEVDFQISPQGKGLVLQLERFPKNTQYLWLTPVALKEQLNYEITLQK